MRDGTYVGSWAAKDIDNNTLIRHMVGRELNDIFPKTEVPIGDVLMEVKHFSKAGQYQDISFSVRRGEILGVAGLIGAGRTELMNGIFGLEAPDSGEIVFQGKKLVPKRPQEAIRHGIAYVTEDRKNEGLVLEMSVAANITLASMRELSKNLFISRSAEKRTVDEQIEALRIKVHTPGQLVGRLSGGNQQKVIFGREVIHDPKLVVAAQPVRGLDIGAIEYVHKTLLELKEQGKAILLISAELSEIMNLSDRIAVLYEGEVSAQFVNGTYSKEEIGLFMAGKKAEV